MLVVFTRCSEHGIGHRVDSWSHDGHISTVNTRVGEGNIEVAFFSDGCVVSGVLGLGGRRDLHVERTFSHWGQIRDVVNCERLIPISHCDGFIRVDQTFNCVADVEWTVGWHRDEVSMDVGRSSVSDHI